MKQKIPRLPEKLADFLKVPSVDALRRFLKRYGIIEGKFKKTEPLSTDQVKQTAHQYAITGSAATREQASVILDSLQEKVDSVISESPNDYKKWTADKNGRRTDSSFVQVDETNSPEKTKTDTFDPKLHKPKTDRETDSIKRTVGKTDIENGLSETHNKTDSPIVVGRQTDWIEYIKDGLLTMVALVAMSVQIVNTAMVVLSAESSKGMLAIAHAWGYAFAIQFTGLALTLYKGGVNYLRIFAFAEFFINLLYFKPWAKNTLESWFTAFLLSALIAFAIYSYVEIFSARRRHKTDTHE